MRTKLILLCFALLMACSGKNSTPKGVLPKEKMINILLDIYIAESKVNDLKVSRDSALVLFDVYEDMLFEKHAVSDSVYRHSLSYYYDHPEHLEDIYEVVLDSLNLKEQRLKESKGEVVEEVKN